MTERLFHCATATFEAARHLPRLGAKHPASRLHGHGFSVDVQARLPAGWPPYAGAEVETLRTALAAAVEPLDYRPLNELIEDPTDLRLARWLRARLEVPGVERLGVQSTQQQGTDLDRTGAARVWRRYALQSAHRLPNVPAGHKCARVHGHGFEVVLRAAIAPSTQGPECAYDRLDALWAPLHAQLDHRYLNEVPGLENPTSEMLTGWLWTRLSASLPQLASVTVYETGHSGATFDGTRYGIWKELSFDGAVSLPEAPDGDPLRRLHGHTYVLRLHLGAPLDELLGWTVDFGAVRAAFDPVFERVDHRPLHELPQLPLADSANLARWLKRELTRSLPQLDRIDLYERRGCGAVLCWSDRDVALPV